MTNFFFPSLLCRNRLKQISFILAAIFFSIPAARGQTALTANGAYEYLQAQRAAAEKVQGGAEKAPADSLKKAEKILQDALTYYDSPAVRELAGKDKALFSRKGDISFDLALVEIKLGKTSPAARNLEYPLKGAYAAAYAEYIRQNSIFFEVLKDPVVASLMAKAEAAKRVFEGDALKTPYKPDISEDEKVAGLSKLWSEAKYNFAYFDHIPEVDWDKLYLDYLPKIRSTKSTVAYLNVLKSFCAQLRDGHTDVWPSDPALVDLTSHRPPIRTILIGDKVFVQEVLQDSLLKTGIKPALEVVSVDGLAVKEYAERFVQPYQSGSTAQNIEVNTYTYRLFAGARDKPVTLTFRDQKGETFTRVLPRSGYSNITPWPSFHMKILPGNIAYVQLKDFESDKALNAFRAAFDSIAASSALIIDVRMNGGGDSGYGLNVLGYLTDKPILTGSYSSRIYSPLRRARGESVVFEPVDDSQSGWPANGKKLYTRPVVVLTSGRTFSAAEDFAVAFDAMKRGTIVGEPTGGSTGQPLRFSLPGGVSARVCTKRDMYPDGTEWIGKGIQPDVLVKPTATDFQSGQDTVLNAALAFLKKGNSPEQAKAGGQ